MADLEKYLTRAEMERALAENLSMLDEEASALFHAHSVGSPRELLDFEKAAAAAGARFADRLVESKILQASIDPRIRKAAAKSTRDRFREQGETRRIDNLGPRPVSVRLAGGRLLRLQTPYLRPSRKGLVGRPRTKRGPDGSGRYPVLEMLGIEDGVTPLTRSKFSRQVVLCSSYQEAVEQLQADGLTADVSTVVRVAVSTGQRGLVHRDEAINRALSAPLPQESLVAGKRIRISLDGGRARTRHTHTDRRKKKNGRRAFELQWREPRLITVDVLDDEGRMDADTPPIYEVEIGDADQVFEKLAGLLRLLGAHQAAEVVFVADGADWIWARVDALISRVELPAERVHKVLDYYHASEHIGDAVSACKNLSDGDRRALHRELASLLLQPEGPEKVIKRLSELARGRRARPINKEIRYLRKHQDHMSYAACRSAKIPIGSGVVESAIRRVINMRFKAASMCWREDHLGALMYLRAVLKAGRWDEFLLANIEGRHWLGEGASKAHLSAIQAA